MAEALDVAVSMFEILILGVVICENIDVLYYSFGLFPDFYPLPLFMVSSGGGGRHLMFTSPFLQASYPASFSVHPW